MTFQERMVDMTERAADSFYRNCRAVPEDKREWKPEETARTVLDIAQECAYSSLWMIPMIETGKPPSFTPEELAKSRDVRASWTTIEACEAASRANLKLLVVAILATPDARLDDEISLPFAEGLKETTAGIISMTYWNYVYHNGQVAYIQRLYGDVDMHM